MRYALLFSGALVFAVLYSPQPLLPGIERLYGAPPGSAGLGMALPLLGLVLGPWCFRRWAAPGEQKLFWGTLGVGVFSLVSLVVPGLVWWALARFLVGFALSAVAVLGFALLPRLFPSPYAVSAFVALNALGGTLGRFLAGVLGEGLGVRTALLIISLPVLILAGFFLTGRAPPLPEPRAARPGRAMLVGGALLFSNLFLANLFPYRLEALGFGLGAIGGFYLAYLGGLVGPFVSGKWGLKAALGLVFLGASLMAGPWLGVGFALFSGRDLWDARGLRRRFRPPGRELGLCERVLPGRGAGGPGVPALSGGAFCPGARDGDRAPGRLRLPRREGIIRFVCKRS